jgi:hypothetical protein
MARALWVEGRGYALLGRDEEYKDVGDRNGCVVSGSLSSALVVLYFVSLTKIGSRTRKL